MGGVSPYSLRNCFGDASVLAKATPSYGRVGHFGKGAYPSQGYPPGALGKGPPLRLLVPTMALSGCGKARATLEGHLPGQASWAQQVCRGNTRVR